MSAYLEDPYHIGRLAAFLVRKDESHGFFRHHLNETEPTEFGPALATILARWNLESVKTRYPGDADVDDVPGKINLPGPGWIDNETDFVLECRAQSRRRFSFDQHSTLEILQACDGLEYQSCETERWTEHPGYFWLQQIRKEAIRCLPGYRDANGWSLQPKKRPESSEDYINGALVGRQEEAVRLALKGKAL